MPSLMWNASIPLRAEPGYRSRQTLLSQAGDDASAVARSAARGERRAATAVVTYCRLTSGTRSAD